MYHFMKKLSLKFLSAALMLFVFAALNVAHAAEITLDKDGVFKVGEWRLIVGATPDCKIVKGDDVVCSAIYFSIQTMTKDFWQCRGFGPFKRVVDIGEKKVEFTRRVPLGDNLSMPVNIVFRAEGEKILVRFKIDEGEMTPEELNKKVVRINQYIKRITGVLDFPMEHFKGKSYRIDGQSGTIPLEPAEVDKAKLIRIYDAKNVKQVELAPEDKIFSFKLNIKHTPSLQFRDWRRWKHQNDHFDLAIDYDNLKTELELIITPNTEAGIRKYEVFLGERERYGVRRVKLANPEGRNLISNGSFELGAYNWKPYIYRNTWHSWVTDVPKGEEMRWQIDKSTSANGTASLLIEGMTDDRSRLNLSSLPPLFLSNEKDYMLSFFIKGEGFIIKVGGKSFILTKDWQRYSVAINPQSVHRHLFYFELVGKGKLWLDAVQLEEGSKATAFSSDSTVEFGLLVDKDDNIYYSGEIPALHFYLYNGRERTAKGEVTYKVKNFYHNVVEERNFPFILKPGEKKEVTRKLDLKEKGIFWVRAVLSEESAEKKDIELNFAIISPLNGDDPFFGASQWGGNNPQKQFKIAKDIGMSFFVPYGPFQYGNSAVPRDWRERVKSLKEQTLPYVLELAGKYNFSLVGELGGIPSWEVPIKERIGMWKHTAWGLPSQAVLTEKILTNFSDFTFTTVDRFKGSIKYWEIWHEAMGPSKEEAGVMIKFLKAASESARKADPDCIILGHAFNRDFVRQANFAFEQGGLDYLDIVTIHPYSYLMSNYKLESLGEKLEKLRALMREYGKEKPVWVTEVGRQAVNTFYINYPYPGAGIYSRVCSEEAQADIIVKANIIAKAHDVKRFATFIISGVTRMDQEHTHGMTIGWCREPKAIIPAYSTVATLLSNSSFIEEIKGIEDLSCYVFRQEKGSYITALWDKSEKNQDKRRAVKLLIPLNPDKAKVVNLMNNPVLPETKRNGICLILPDATPVFLITKKNPCSFLKETVVRIKEEILEGRLTLKDFNSPSKRLELSIHNRSSEKVSLKVEVRKLPPDWQLKEGTVHELEVQGGEIVTVPFFLKKARFPIGEKDYEIEVKVSTVKESFFVRIAPILCPFLQIQPVIDGDLSEWENFPPLLLDKTDLALLPGIPLGDSIPNSAKVYLGWNKDSFYFAAEVTDDKFNQPYKGGWIWAGDSIQIAFDTLNNAIRKNHFYNNDDYEYNVGLTPDGPGVSPGFHGTAVNKEIVKKVRLEVKRRGNKIYYEAAFPWSCLLPFKPAEGNLMGFNFTIMDNDGEDRPQKWLELTPGIVLEKYPFVFKDLILLEAVHDLGHN